MVTKRTKIFILECYKDTQIKNIRKTSRGLKPRLGTTDFLTGKERVLFPSQEPHPFGFRSPSGAEAPIEKSWVRHWVNTYILNGM